MTTKAEVLKAIRKHCLECMGGSWVDVRDCTSIITPHGERRCALYPYRFGKDPKPARGGYFGQRPKDSESSSEQDDVSE